MLECLFAWSNSNETHATFNDVLITHGDFIQANNEARTHAKRLIAQIRLAKLAGKSETPIAELKLSLEHTKSYLQFLAALSPSFQAEHPQFLFILALEHALTCPPTPLVSKKIESLISTLLQNNTAAINQFYEQHANKFHSFPVALSLIQAHKIQQAYEKLVPYFIHQDHPQAIAPLFTSRIEQPDDTAGFILLLLRHGVTAEQILETPILHDFFSYHLITLHEPNSVIHMLYAGLSQFPEALELIRLANKTRYNERGFDAYALTGVLQLQDELASCPIQRECTSITPSLDNAHALYRLFHDSFLLMGFEYHVRNKDPQWSNVFKKMLNTPLVSSQHRAYLINYTAEHAPHYLGQLAALFTPQTLRHAILEQQTAILHLLPHNEALYHQLPTAVIIKCINQIHALPSDLNTMTQLISLFNACDSNHNIEMARLAYETLIDQVLKAPDAFDEWLPPKSILRFPEKNALITKKHQELEVQFENVLQQATSIPPFQAHHYHIIEDAWHDVLRQYAVLRYFSTKNESWLSNKYTLYVRVAQKMLENQPALTPDALLETIFNLSPELSKPDITPYERALIELLAALPNPDIRNELISKLALKYDSPKQWVAVSYGKKTILQHAVLYGNISFFRWLEQKNMLPSPTIDSLIPQAIETNQWDMVHYFFGVANYRPKNHLLKLALIQAAGTGELDSVRYLSKISQKKPNQAHFNQVFTQAVQNNHPHVVEFLLTLTGKQAPNPTSVISGLKIAIQKEQLDMIHTIRQFPQNELIDTAVIRLLYEKIQQGNCPVVDALLAYPCTQQPLVIEKTLLLSIKYNHPDIIQKLLRAPPCPPRIPALHQALLHATQYNRAELVEQLCRSLPNENTLIRTQVQSLFLSIEQHHSQLVDYFITSLADNLTFNEVQRALTTAIKSGHLEITQRLITHVQEYHPQVLSKHHLHQHIKCAMQAKHPLIEHCLRQLKKTPQVFTPSVAQFSLFEAPAPADEKQQPNQIKVEQFCFQK